MEQVSNGHEPDARQPGAARSVALSAPVESARPAGTVHSSALPLVLLVASLAVLYGVTFWVVSPNVERWIACRGAFSGVATLLLIAHHAIGTLGFSAVWGISLLLLCWQVGGRYFHLMLAIDFFLCAFAAAEGLAALYLLAQRCG